MSSQSIVADLSLGDRVQIYMYTHTGTAKEYIYIYNKGNPPPVINSVAVYPRKQEAVRKTTPELLSAVFRNSVGCLCVPYFTIVCSSFLFLLAFSGKRPRN